jgi:putative oxidoreductase
MTWAPWLLSILRIAAGLLFMQHGGEKLWGFAGGRIDHNFPHLHALAGPIELIGGLLLVMGLFTRTTAFILCGEMAVAYFQTWAPRGFFPISNGGEEAVLFCFLYLWLVTSGGGPWSLDALLERPALLERRQGLSRMTQTVSSWEPYVRSIMRVILAFVFRFTGTAWCTACFPKSPGAEALGGCRWMGCRSSRAILPLSAAPSWFWDC